MEPVLMDLSPGEVHTPSAIAPPSAGASRAARKAARKAKRAAGQGRGTIHVRADLAPGGALHVRHMTSSDDGRQAVVQLSDGTLGLRDIRAIKKGAEEIDPTDVGVGLIGPALWSDGSPVKLVWVQLAECGAWKGHPAGSFSMTPATFSEIVRNFELRGLPVPWDYEHASEQDATSGSVPTTGAPAPAWVHRLDNRGLGGLWGLTEFLDQARAQITKGEYAFLSPAVRFGSRDPVTGAIAGARLTSVALTNQPFLTGLDQLRAAKDSAVELPAGSLLCSGRFSERPGGRSQIGQRLHDDATGRIRSGLKLHPFASLHEMADHLDRLRDACMSAGPAGVFQGCNLSDFMAPLADVAGMGPGASHFDILDALDEFVDDEIEKHVFQGMPMPDPPSAMAATDKTPTAEEMTTMEVDKIALKDAQDKAKSLEEKVTAKDAEIKTLTDKGAAVDALLTSKSAEIVELTSKISARDTLITAKDAEIKTLSDKVVELTAKVDKIESDAKAEADKVAKAEEERVVENRFKAHGDRTKMSKDAFAALFRTDRPLFDREFPEVPADQMHMLRAITPAAPAPTLDADGKPVQVVDGAPGRPSRDALVESLMGDGLSLGDARTEADILLRDGDAAAYLAKKNKKG